MSHRDMLSAQLRIESFNALPHGKPDEYGSKAWALMGTVVRYRQAAFQTLLAESPELRLAVTQRKRDTMKAIALANQGKMVSPQVAADRQRVRGLLQSFGIKPPAFLQ